jgi:uncharacterized membrane protein YphA (DoxX/SURF4 family)
MLNPFPIQFLALFAYFLLRVFLGSILIYLGLLHYKHRNELKHILKLSWFPYGTLVAFVFPAGELFIGSLIVLGAYTQYAALAAALMSIKMLVIRNCFNHSSLPSKLFYFLFLGVSISLFITGAGALAFDLPI